MRRNGILQGKTTEEKLFNLDRVLCQLMNRSTRDVGIRMAPMILNVYVDSYKEGSFYNFLFPICGSIDSVSYCVDGLKAGQSCDVEVEVIKPSSGAEFHRLCAKKLVLTATIGKRVEIGTKLSVKFSTPIEFTSFWMSIVFNADIHHTKLHTAVVEEIEKNYEKLQANLSIEEGSSVEEEQSKELGLSNSSEELQSGATGNRVVKSYTRSAK